MSPFLSPIGKWFPETETWQCLTDLAKEDKQPATIYLSLIAKIRKTCLDIKV